MNLKVYLQDQPEAEKQVTGKQLPKQAATRKRMAARFHFMFILFSFRFHFIMCSNVLLLFLFFQVSMFSFFENKFPCFKFFISPYFQSSAE